jgi:hypothetical protein
MRAKITDGKAIDIGDTSDRRHSQRLMQRANFNALPTQKYIS